MEASLEHPQYLTITCPDLAYSVNIVSLESFQTEKKKHLFNTYEGLDLDIHIHSKSTLNLYAFVKSDWVGCKLTRWTMNGFFAPFLVLT